MALAPSTSGSLREAPQNVEVERALLGALLIRNALIGEVLESLPAAARAGLYPLDAPPARPRPGDEPEPLFAHRPNQEVFEVIVHLHGRDQGVDLTTLAEELERRGRYEAVGGKDYLLSLEEELVTSTLYVPDYVRILVEKWRRRSLLRAAEAIARDVAGNEEDAEEVIQRSEQRLFELAHQSETAGFVHVGEIAADEMAQIESRAREDLQGIAGLPTGFTELDRLTTGLRPSNLVILAARPSVGKSAFALNIAAEVAVRRSRPVGVFSLEMSRAELTHRLLCALAGVPMDKLRANRAARRELERMHVETQRLNTAPLYIDDSPDLSILDLRSRARRLKARCPGLALLVVDYLQLMRAPVSRNDNRQQEVALISRALKALARELEIPVLALSQLSRQSEQRTGPRRRDRLPRLSDLRESGAIEQDADVVIFIHREIYPRTDQPPPAPDEPDLATVIIGKQRNGPTGTFEVLFRRAYTQFVNVHADSHGGASPF